MSKRTPEYPINPLILNRRSKRAMNGEVLDDEEFLPLIEAAKWAPSCFNNQPWRFFVGKKGSSFWDHLFGSLIEFNQSWAKNASHLILIVSVKNFEHNGKFSKTHSFDTGAAWANMALEGTSRGLVVHAMAGFNYDKAKEALNIGDEMQIEAMVAVGKPGTATGMGEKIEEGEKKPSMRKALADIIIDG